MNIHRALIMNLALCSVIFTSVSSYNACHLANEKTKAWQGYSICPNSYRWGFLIHCSFLSCHLILFNWSGNKGQLNSDSCSSTAKNCFLCQGFPLKGMPMNFKTADRDVRIFNLLTTLLGSHVLFWLGIFSRKEASEYNWNNNNKHICRDTYSVVRVLKKHVERRG